MLRHIKKIVPAPLFELFQPAYHWLLAKLAAVVYGWPSRQLKVIGVTGTSGKSTVVELIDKVLSENGYKVGVASTIKFKVNDWEQLNDKKMTMIGRFQLQKLLSRMVKADCNYAIVETTSEGIRQFRHKGIHYDTLVFTNLYPEHIDSHGSFENYKAAKLKLFKHLENLPHKVINNARIPKVIIANLDDEHSKDFLAFKVDEKIGFSAANKAAKQLTNTTIIAEAIERLDGRMSFKIKNLKLKIKLLGLHNVYNALAATCVGLSQGVGLEKISVALAQVTGIPGRQEFIGAGQKFKVIVDYAFEPRAIAKLYELVKSIPHQRVIQVMGTTGGGRDASHGLVNGKNAGQFVDIIIATNEDPYDDDPEMLMDRVARGAQEAGQQLDKNLFKVLDRREAIARALAMAQANDIVLITGKGSEQGIVSSGKILPWDDRVVVREELEKLR